MSYFFSRSLAFFSLYISLIICFGSIAYRHDPIDLPLFQRERERKKNWCIEMHISVFSLCVLVYSIIYCCIHACIWINSYFDLNRTFAVHTKQSNKKKQNPFAITRTNHMGENIATEKWQNRILSRIYENYFPSIDFKIFKPEHVSFEKTDLCAINLQNVICVGYVMLLVSSCFIYIYICVFFSLCPLLVHFWIAREQHFKMTILYEFRYGTSCLNFVLFVHELVMVRAILYVLKWEWECTDQSKPTSCNFAMKKENTNPENEQKTTKNTNWLL